MSCPPFSKYRAAAILLNSNGPGSSQVSAVTEYNQLPRGTVLLLPGRPWGSTAGHLTKKWEED